MRELMPEEGFKEDARRIEFLFRTVCNRMLLYGREVLSRHHLSPPQFEIMVVIYFQGELSQADLPKKLHIAKSTVSALLERLERAGMISKHKTTRDKRISTVRLTFKGANVIEQVIERRTGLVKEFLSQLNATERREFIKIISRFAYILETGEGNI